MHVPKLPLVWAPGAHAGEGCLHVLHLEPHALHMYYMYYMWVLGIHGYMTYTQQAEPWGFPPGL